MVNDDWQDISTYRHGVEKEQGKPKKEALEEVQTQTVNEQAQFVHRTRIQLRNAIQSSTLPFIQNIAHHLVNFLERQYD